MSAALNVDGTHLSDVRLDVDSFRVLYSTCAIINIVVNKIIITGIVLKLNILNNLLYRNASLYVGL